MRDRWLPSLDTLVAGGKLKPNTRSSYQRQVEVYVLPRLGHVLLKDVSADMLARFYGELLTSGRCRVGKGEDAPKGLGPTSVRLVHVTIHRMLKDAVRWGILVRNAADAASEDVPERRKSGKATGSPISSGSSSRVSRTIACLRCGSCSSRPAYGVARSPG
jgi:integrase